MKFNYRELFKGLSQYRTPRNFELTGQVLDIKLDGFGNCKFDIISEECLYLDFGEIHQKNRYEAYKIDDYVYFMHFEIEGQTPRRCISMVYDKGSGQIALFFARQGHCKEYIRKVDREIYFGSVRQPDGAYPAVTIGYTTDLIGKAIDFTYTPIHTVRHTYIDTHKCKWEFVQAEEDAVGAWQKEYCDYIRINDHIYIFSWLEKIAGVQGLCVENLERLYHVGGFFGIGPDDLPECYAMSAYGKPAPYEVDNDQQ